jgi:hypothetical protein
LRSSMLDWSIHTASLPERDPQVEPIASPNPRVTTGPLFGSCRNRQARKLPRLVLTLASRALVYGPTLPPCVPPPLFTVALAGTMPARITGGALLATKMVGRRPPLPPPAPGGGVSKGLCSLENLRISSSRASRPFSPSPTLFPSLFRAPISWKNRHIPIPHNPNPTSDSVTLSAGTMAPQKRRRFLEFGGDLEAKRVTEERSIEECARLDLDDSPDIAESTEKRREGLMTEWKE